MRGQRGAQHVTRAAPVPRPSPQRVRVSPQPVAAPVTAVTPVRRAPPPRRMCSSGNDVCLTGLGEGNAGVKRMRKQLRPQRTVRLGPGAHGAPRETTMAAQDQHDDAPPVVGAGAFGVPLVKEEEHEAETVAKQRNRTGLSARVRVPGPRVIIKVEDSSSGEEEEEEEEQKEEEEEVEVEDDGNVKEEEREEETLAQQRDRMGLSARVPAPRPRATRVIIKVEDSSSGEDTDGGEDTGRGEEEEEEVEDEGNVGWGTASGEADPVEADPVAHREGTSQFKGVFWCKRHGRWSAEHNGKQLGRAVQVHPMKPKFKPPGTKRLKLKCD